MAKRRRKRPEEAPETTQSRILSAATKLLAVGGRDAITTRAVAEAAGVQAPVLYRYFKDKDAMLDALAEHGFRAYMAKKRASSAQDDPVEVLRSGWDLHIEFGLTHPELYLLMYAPTKSGTMSPAGQLAFAILRERIGRVAAAGRLRIPEDQAVLFLHAAAAGVVLVLLNSSVNEREMAISNIARDATFAVLTERAPSSKKAPGRAAAITLRAALQTDSPFSVSELSLLKEWLDRIIK